MASREKPGLPAILGGTPAFTPDNPVPQIFPTGHGYRAGEYSAIDSILANELRPDTKVLSNRQAFVSKGLHGTSPSHRSDLQDRLAGFLDLDPDTTSAICVTSGTQALQAALKIVFRDGRPKTRNEVIMPAITVVSTAEAVLSEGFVPVFVDVDPRTWMLSPEATKASISERTAAIVTVDWLGARCDLGPFRKLADEHHLKLISDSAQGFGASSGRPPAVDLSDASIFSTGFPKVFHTGGSGGILICSKAQAEWLDNEPTGILRRHAMPEENAYQGLRALDELPEVLLARAEVANVYRQLLRHTPGITFQHIPPGLGASHYQLSVVIDAKEFGLNAKLLREALEAENMKITERVRCLDSIPRLAPSCRTSGDLTVGRWLGQNSITLPIFDQLTPELCGTICSRVNAIQRHSASVVKASKKAGTTTSPGPGLPADIIDLASKYLGHSVLNLVDEREFTRANDAGLPSTIFVPSSWLYRNSISMDELHRRCLSKQEWNLDDQVIEGLFVHGKAGGIVVLSPSAEGDSNIADKSVSLDESGSSANVTLVIKPNGQVQVHKTCSEDGVDGNGRPWLTTQMRFLAASAAVRKTDLFIRPTNFQEDDDTTSITFPYLPSHSLGEMALAGMGSGAVLGVLIRLLGDMADNVWCEGNYNAPANFMQQAHLDRMRRRIAIARAKVPELDNIARYKSIEFNGRQLLGFEAVLKALSCHPRLADIAPLKLNEIHGDLNIHNILCVLEPGANRPFVLIDPRGVDLLSESASVDGFEPGDYCYDLSKLLFSLSGFSEIRKGLYSLERTGESYKLSIRQHPGSDTMVGADRGFIAALASNESLSRWVNKVEKFGMKSLALRILLGEAAHFVADSACALGRDRVEEVLPLFLTGIERLNNVLDLLNGKGDPYTDRPKLPVEIEAESPNHGAAIIRSALLKMASPVTPWAWDVLEVLVKSELTATAQQLLSQLVGEYLPEGTRAHVSTHPAGPVKFPCVLVHPYEGTRGQTYAVASTVRRTSAFLRDAGVPEETIDKLRMVTVSSTGAPTRSQLTSRQNDRLLSPGPWGLSPLQLCALQTTQLVFTRPGRWIVDNDSFFILSRDLRIGGDDMCLLMSERPMTGSSSSWPGRVCINSTMENGGRIFATGFREIGPHETEKKLLRTTNAIFMPAHLGQALSRNEADYATRTSPLLIDFVLSRFMLRTDWIKLCHSQGFGVNSDLAWENSQQLAQLSPRVELVNGGDAMKFHYFGSDSEYIKLLDGAGSHPLLKSLTYAPSMARWVRSQDLA
ncbi:hypothetical protein EDB85DRAFT_1508217 [Lactarius pseudohatsudake]|nr:hypothetical protein EDB85DRAFT_1508217 [Lactarius pseudohatsudake]